MDRYEEALERAKAGKPMDEVFPELKECADERIRQMIGNTLRDAVISERISETSYREMSAYLEKQKEQKPAEWKPLPESMEALLLAIEGKWDAIKPTGYMSRRLEDLYDGLVNTFDVDEKYLSNLPKTEYTEKDIEEIKALKEKIDSSMETKPAEWSEEDEALLKEIVSFFKDGTTKLQHDLDLYAGFLENKLKSLRPQPREEIYQSAKHDLAIKFMNYLDENRPEGKMNLSNGECEDIDKAFRENDWAKILRYIEKYGK